MSETKVSAIVAALFGAMVALLIYTRLGGMATIVSAGAVLVVYIVVEIIAANRDRIHGLADRMAYLERMHAWAQWREWRAAEEYASVHDLIAANRKRLNKRR